MPKIVFFDFIGKFVLEKDKVTAEFVKTNTVEYFCSRKYYE